MSIDGRVEIVSRIVSAYVSRNAVQPKDVGQVIAIVHDAFKIAEEPPANAATERRPEPAVPVNKSITRNYLVCLEDGKKFRTLRRHLKTSYDLTPEAYRERWNLPKDYPMVAETYSNLRSKLAKGIGLGTKRVYCFVEA